MPVILGIAPKLASQALQNSRPLRTAVCRPPPRCSPVLHRSPQPTSRNIFLRYLFYRPRIFYDSVIPNALEKLLVNHNRLPPLSEARPASLPSGVWPSCGDSRRIVAQPEVGPRSESSGPR